VFGAIIDDTARKMLDSQEAMTRAIEPTAALDAGELSVGVWPYSGRLPRRYPRLRISIHIDQWESLPDLLRRGRVDLFVASIVQTRGRKEFRVVEFPEQREI
jgi:DNA-binding transcriptional LysR family regulator